MAKAITIGGAEMARVEAIVTAGSEVSIDMWTWEKLSQVVQ